MSKNNTKYECTLNHYFREMMLDIHDSGSIRLVWNTVCMRYFFTTTSAHIAGSLLQVVALLSSSRYQDAFASLAPA